MVSAPASFMVISPVPVSVVNVAAEGLVPPITVPSIVPPLMSAVVTVPKSVHVAPAAVGEVVMVGEVRDGALLNTNKPLPVSSEIDNAAFAEDNEVVRAPPVVVDTNLSADSPEKVMVPELVMAVAPVMAPAFEMSTVGVFNILVKVPVIVIPSVMAPAPSAIRIPLAMVPAVPAI